MNTREKLIELLSEIACKTDDERCRKCVEQDCVRCAYENVADHLIANGVTIATDNNVGDKWIPVTERLPEDFEEVLVFGRSKLTRVMVIYIAFRKGRKWFVPCDEDCIEQDPVIVSHWMPLPLSPEGEEI